MKLKASYTVEASVIICVSFIMFGLAMALAYELYKESINFVGVSENNFDAVRIFRIREALMGVIHAIED